MFNLQFKKTLASFATCAAVAAGALISPDAVYAQEEALLDEITVTAQRREQSLQDVPVSIQTFGGEELNRQGFISLGELANYAPGLVIKDFSEEQGLIVRGAGTQSKNLGVEQGVPTFMDGVHFGRGSQVKNAYMDIDQIEVLKGPQPVFFGQNAAAGALNVTTRKPTDVWEGYVSGEAGSFGKVVLEGAVGGPITDTFGIRVAAKYYELEGFMRDLYTGDKFPERDSKAARMTLQWTPTDKFQSTLKVDWAENDLGPRVNPIVWDKFSDDPFLPHAERVTIIGISHAGVPAPNRSVGQVDDLAFRYGPTYIDPWDEVVASGIPLTEASGSESGVVYDFTECFENGGLQVLKGGLDATDPVVPDDPSIGRQPVRPSQFESCNMADESASKPWHSILDLVYTLESGVEIASKTAFSKQVYHNTPHNSGGGAFATNPRSRGEDFEQWSTELRFTSETGGAIEWMAGMYFQSNELDTWSDAYRGNSRRSIRTMRAHEESDWRSIFATVTFNFMDDKASLDVGGRYTGISKKATGSNQIAEWFVRNDVRQGGDGSIVRVPYGLDVTQGNTGRREAAEEFLATYPGIVNGPIVGRTRFFGGDGCDSLLGETHPAGQIGSQRCASVESQVSDDSFDPQVVFRYRPNEDMSYYVKYATSFKSGAFDMGVSEVPRSAGEFTFGPEEYEIWEIGLRGTFMDGRLAAEATAYMQDMTGVQVTLVDRILDRSVTKNIAEQESDGLELSARFAATDRLTLSGYVAFLDAVINEFPNAVCSEDERLTGDCGEDGTIDRSGAPARNAPDWQFTGNLRYELPTIISGLRADFDLTFTATDAYIQNRDWSKAFSWDQEEDISVSLEVGSEEGRWSLLFYGRNLLEARPTYFAQFDARGDGQLGSEAQIGTSNFASYGARFTLNFD